MQTAIEFCTQALIKIGANGISSFDEGTAESTVAKTLYDTTRDYVLSLYEWSFARNSVNLSPITAKPVSDFTTAYQKPDNILRVSSVGDTSQKKSVGVDFRIFERYIYTDCEDGITLSGVFRVDEAYFPPHFVPVIVAALAREFALPLTENSTRYQTHAQEFETAFARAKSADAMQQTPRSIFDNAYTLDNVR